MKTRLALELILFSGNTRFADIGFGTGVIKLSTISVLILGSFGKVCC